VLNFFKLILDTLLSLTLKGLSFRIVSWCAHGHDVIIGSIYFNKEFRLKPLNKPSKDPT
jgi:hypothetical protein